MYTVSFRLEVSEEVVLRVLLYRCLVISLVSAWWMAVAWRGVLQLVANSVIHSVLCICLFMLNLCCCKVTSENCFASDLRNTDFVDVAIARKI